MVYKEILLALTDDVYSRRILGYTHKGIFIFFIGQNACFLKHFHQKLS
jgi:hypothetical protein